MMVVILRLALQFDGYYYLGKACGQENEKLSHLSKSFINLFILFSDNKV